MSNWRATARALESLVIPDTDVAHLATPASSWPKAVATARSAASRPARAGSMAKAMADAAVELERRRRPSRVPTQSNPEGTVVVGRPEVLAANEMPLAGDRVGEVLDGSYRVERHIATGGMGSVYEVAHTRLGQRFAVKFLERGAAHDHEAYARFRQEAEIAAGLNHTSIVQVFDFNTDRYGNPYMVMELVEGQTLDRWIYGERRLNHREIMRIFEPLCMALDVAHQHGIVHRDLKPSNIMVRRAAGGFRVKLLDFGISKIKHGEGEGMTRDNIVMGTPNYMSPEQANGQNREVDARTDIFALGAILYEALGGKKAFQAESVPKLLHAIVYEDPPPLADCGKSIPAGVLRVVERCLAKNVDDRFSSARILLQALKAGYRTEERRVAAPPAAPRRSAAVWTGLWIASLAATFAGATWLAPTVVAQPTAEAIVVPPVEPPAPQPPPVDVRPKYEASLATPGARVLQIGEQLYRADGGGLSHWPEPEAQATKRSLPSASAVTSLSQGERGEILVGQADGTVSRWDRELRDKLSHARYGRAAVAAAASGSGYLAVANSKAVRLVSARTGKTLRTFPGPSAPLSMALSKGQQPMLVIVRPTAVEVVDADQRQSLTSLPLGAHAVRASVRANVDGPTELDVDFAQGDWLIVREYRVHPRQRSQAPRLELVGQSRR